MGPSKMSLLLEAKSTLALIMKTRLIIVVHMGDLNWYITSNQQGQNLNRIVSKPNVTPGQVLYYTTHRISINLMFHESLLLTHKIGSA